MTYDAYLQAEFWRHENAEQEALGAAIEAGEMCPMCLAEICEDECECEKKTEALNGLRITH